MVRKVKLNGIEVEVEVEQCPPGVCIGAIDTVVDRGIRNWGSACVGFGGLMKNQKAKKGKLKLNFRRK